MNLETDFLELDGGKLDWDDGCSSGFMAFGFSFFMHFQDSGRGSGSSKSWKINFKDSDLDDGCG